MIPILLLLSALCRAQDSDIPPVDDSDSPTEADSPVDRVPVPVPQPADISDQISEAIDKVDKLIELFESASDDSAIDFESAPVPALSDASASVDS